MSGTLWSPPSREDQAREAAERNPPVDGLVPDNGDGIPEIVEDTPPPAPAPAPEVKAEEPAPEEKPEPTPFEDPRKAIAERYRKQRAEEREKFIAHTVDGDPLFLNGEKPAEEEPAAQTEETPPAPAPAAKTYEVKVNGRSASVTREQLLAMADLSAEDANGLPDSTLVKAAQITEASRQRLQAAKETTFGTAPAPAAPAATPAANQEPTTAPDNRRPASEIPSLKDRLEKLQYGDPEEAETAFVSAINDVLANTRRAEREQAIRAETDRAILDFNQTNTDISTHEHASRYVLTESTNEIIKDLRALGAPEANLREALINPALAIEAHRDALVAGYPVRKPADILAAAGNTVRQQFGLTRAAPRTAPSTAPAAATNDRLAAKRALTQQPQRSGNPVAAVEPAGNRSRSSVVQQMRQRRGQPTAA